MPSNLRQLGIRIRPFPTRDPRFTSDEAELTKRLMRPDETGLSPRVAHDVDCVAAVITRRRGHHPDSLDGARAVFATTSSSVLSTVREWYIATGERGVAPVVHAWALSNIAWLKKPVGAAGMRLHELVALCAAALTPSARVWQSFLKQLRRLESAGEITSEEKVAIVVAELTETHLAEIDEGVEVDSPTVAEIVERVRMEHVAEVTRASDAKLDAARARIEEADRQLAVEKSVSDSHAQKASAEAEGRRQLRLQVHGRANSIADFLAVLVCLMIAAVVAAGLALAMPIALPQRLDWLRWPTGGCAAVFSFLALWRGTTFAGIRAGLRGRMATRITKWWLGPSNNLSD
jgi:hypothetical protein